MALLIRNESQEWLIRELRQKTGRYVDSSILYKIMRGAIHSDVLEKAIKEILNL